MATITTTLVTPPPPPLQKQTSSSLIRAFNLLTNDGNISRSLLHTFFIIYIISSSWQKSKQFYGYKSSGGTLYSIPQRSRRRSSSNMAILFYFGTSLLGILIITLALYLGNKLLPERGRTFMEVYYGITTSLYGNYMDLIHHNCRFTSGKQCFVSQPKMISKMANNMRTGEFGHSISNKITLNH